MLGIVNLHASETKVIGGFEYDRRVYIEAKEVIELKENEVGIILGKHGLMQKGIEASAGIVHLGWKGKLTIKLTAFEGADTIKEGEEIAHLLIIEDKDCQGVLEID